MTAIRIYSPEGSVGRAGPVLAPVPEALAGRRILVLDNGKPGADRLLRHLAESLAARTGAIAAGTVRKGSAATPCEEPLFQEMDEARCDEAPGGDPEAEQPETTLKIQDDALDCLRYLIRAGGHLVQRTRRKKQG